MTTIKTINATLQQQLDLIGASAADDDSTMHTVSAGRVVLRVLASRAGTVARALAKTARSTRGAYKTRGNGRSYPKFAPGMSTARYVELYKLANEGAGGAQVLPFDALNEAPATLYEGGALDYVPVHEIDTSQDEAATLQVAAVMATAQAIATAAQPAAHKLAGAPATTAQASAESATPGSTPSTGRAAHLSADYHAAPAGHGPRGPADSGRTEWARVQDLGADERECDTPRDLDATTAAQGQRANSKTGAWSARLYRDQLGQLAMRFEGVQPGAVVLTYANAADRMAHLQHLAREADAAHHATQHAQQPTPQRAQPVALDPRVLLAAGVAAEELRGIGVSYNGDAANAPGSGAITHAEQGQHGLQITVTLEDGRTWCAHPHSFADAPGNRLRFDHKMHGAPYLAELAAAAASAKARKTSGQEQAHKAHQQALQDLPSQFPQLVRATSTHEGGKLAAKNARILLKAAFPGVKFSVTSDYNSLRIRWTDGPTVAAVDGVVGRFDIGASDTQTDYFYTVKTAFSELFGGVQYLSTNRDESPELVARALDAWHGTTAWHAATGQRATVEDWKRQTGPFAYNERDADFYRRQVRELLASTSGN